MFNSGNIVLPFSRSSGVPQHTCGRGVSETDLCPNSHYCATSEIPRTPHLGCEGLEMVFEEDMGSEEAKAELTQFFGSFISPGLTTKSVENEEEENNFLTFFAGNEMEEENVGASIHAQKEDRDSWALEEEVADTGEEESVAAEDEPNILEDLSGAFEVTPAITGKEQVPTMTAKDLAKRHPGMDLNPILADLFGDWEEVMCFSLVKEESGTEISKGAVILNLDLASLETSGTKGTQLSASEVIKFPTYDELSSLQTWTQTQSDRELEELRLAEDEAQQDHTRQLLVSAEDGKLNQYEVQPEGTEEAPGSESPASANEETPERTCAQEPESPSLERLTRAFLLEGSVPPPKNSGLQSFLQAFQKDSHKKALSSSIYAPSVIYEARGVEKNAIWCSQEPSTATPPSSFPLLGAQYAALGRGTSSGHSCTTAHTSQVAANLQTPCFPELCKLGGFQDTQSVLPLSEEQFQKLLNSDFLLQGVFGAEGAFAPELSCCTVPGAFKTPAMPPQKRRKLNFGLSQTGSVTGMPVSGRAKSPKRRVAKGSSNEVQEHPNFVYGEVRVPFAAEEHYLSKEPNHNEYRIERTRFTRPSLDAIKYMYPNVLYERNPSFSRDAPYQQEWTRVELDPSNQQPFNSTRYGLCPYCAHLKFCNLKNSSYALHLATAHGVFTDNTVAPHPVNRGMYTVTLDSSGKKEKIHAKPCPGVQCPECMGVIHVECWKAVSPWTNYTRHYNLAHKRKQKVQ